MSDTAAEVQMGRMNRMKKLTESTTPDAHAYAFAWLAGAATINPELREHLDKAINYVERTFTR